MIYQRTIFGDEQELKDRRLSPEGFPCQPFSVAGLQRGKLDDRYLWPEMLRVITELGPDWVVGENVPGILRIAADDVCEGLERAGYEVFILDFEAAAVGAHHRRERIAFVAHARGRRLGGARGVCELRDVFGGAPFEGEADEPGESGEVSATLADTYHSQRGAEAWHM